MLNKYMDYLFYFNFRNIKMWEKNVLRKGNVIYIWYCNLELLFKLFILFDI